jgi:branched-chain amino acid transport system permease protein
VAHHCGDFKVSYRQDNAVFQTAFVRTGMALLFLWLLGFPFVLKWLAGVLPFKVKVNYLLNLVNLIGIYIIGAHGLNILTGFTGQISLGHGAFMGVGAYASAILVTKAGFSFWIALPAAGLVTALIGMIFGIPSLRLKGLYLAIATMAAQFIIEYAMRNWTALTGGSSGMMAPSPSFFNIALDNDARYYYLVYAMVILVTIFTRNLFRTRAGRAFVAIRDRYISAEVMGVNLFWYRILSFGVSSFLVGLAGGLYAHYNLVVSDEHFHIWLSVQYLAMIIIGGLGSVLGAIYGAIFMTLLPELIRIPADMLSGTYPQIFSVINQIREGVFGLVIILFLIFEPDGLAARWHTIKNYWKLWPFSY